MPIDSLDNTMSKDKKEDKVDPPILIVSDSADEVRTAKELLQIDNKNIFSADNTEAGLTMFQAQLPLVLVLAFQELEKSERFYLMLHRRCPEINEIPHQTLLLCKSNEIEAAFMLCRDGTFDDYIINRPMHDPFRVRLAVKQALMHQAKLMQMASLNYQLSHIGSDLRELDSFVNKGLAGGQSQQAESLNAFRKFSTRLTRELDRFGTSMSDPALGEAAKLIEHSGLRKQFDQLRQSSVEPAAREVEGKLKEAQQWVRQFDEGYREEVSRIKEHDFPPPLPGVLLVDDDDMYREMLGAMFDGADVRVSMTDSGEAALVEMQRRRPDIVLLDYNMPGLGGIATLKKMKSDVSLKQIPVLMLTGISARETVQEVILAGAAGFIVKPGNRETILTKIRDLLPKPGNAPKV